jgi:CRISPR/Cas system-associated endoribonuclease Cas2
MFYKYNYATCFDHNFDHHQALNEHISSNQTHWIQYGSVFVNRLLSFEHVKGKYYKDTIMIKRYKNIRKVKNIIKKYKKWIQYQMMYDIKDLKWHKNIDMP